jgi:hypothetical protein
VVGRLILLSTRFSMRALATMKIDLETGCLMPLLDRVRRDRTVQLEFRDGYVDVYYRGGCITKVTPCSAGGYELTIDPKYFERGLSSDARPPSAAVVRDAAGCIAWLSRLGSLKDQMDLWFGKHAKNEREAQQQLARENNWGQSGQDSDYFVLDIEYQEPGEKGRFDALAVHWPSKSHVRGKGAQRGFAFLELKWCDAAVASFDGKGSPKPGIRKHVRDLESFVGSSGRFGALKDAMREVFNDKLELGLMPYARCRLDSFSDERPQFLIVLINHDPAKSKLLDELEALKCEGVSPLIDLRFARANHFGYALYEERMRTLDELLVELRSDPVRRGSHVEVDEEDEKQDG